MASRDEIVRFLDQVLEVKEVKDPYCPNGLQVEGKESVEKIGFAVDACQQTFEAPVLGPATKLPVYRPV